MLIRANCYDAVLHPMTPWSRVQSSCKGIAFASALCGFLPQSAEGFSLGRKMRRLVHIPIIHTAADLGSLSELVRTHYMKVWATPVGTIASKPSKPSRTKSKRISTPSGWTVGSPHLPGRVAHLWLRGADRPELAKAGSSNHQLILRLLDQGATQMGTEDPSLLMEEYEMQKRHLARERVAFRAGKHRPEKHLDRVLQARDAFVVKRISDTLQEGEIGLLFLGALHRFDSLRSTDLRLETLGECPEAGQLTAFGSEASPLREAIRRPGSQHHAAAFPPRPGKSPFAHLRKAAAPLCSTKKVNRIKCVAVAGRFRQSRYPPCNCREKPL